MEPEWISRRCTGSNILLTLPVLPLACLLSRLQAHSSLFACSLSLVTTSLHPATTVA